VNEALWARQIRRAAVNVEEKTVLNFFKTLLYKIHPLDYEKIRFVCAWIIDSLDDGMEEEEKKNEKNEKSETDNENLNKKIENIAVEIESCRKYSDILIFLSGLNFPVEATKKVKETINLKNKNENDNIDLNNSIINTVSTDFDCYMNVPSVYQTRIPFWDFLADPWLIITPLLKEVMFYMYIYNKYKYMFSYMRIIWNTISIIFMNTYIYEYKYLLLGCSVISLTFNIYMLNLLLMPLAGLHICVGLCIL
jgi:hypothetical protein